MEATQKKQTKAEIKTGLIAQVGRGQRMITGAEFEYGIAPRTIDRATFDARVKAGNDLIMSAWDRASELRIRLPF